MSSPSSFVDDAACPGLRFAGWTLDLGNRRLIRRDGQAVPLSASAFALLASFAAHPGETLSRERLSAVLQREYTAYDRLIDVHVSQIRRILGRQPDGSDFICTRRNEGYIFVAAVERL